MERIGETLKKMGATIPSGTASHDLLAENFNCKICRDAGRIHPCGTDGKIDYSQTIPCKCQSGRETISKHDRLMKYCHLPAATSDRTFENFDAYTPDLKEALAAAQDFTKPESKIKCLILMSPVDRGKSHLAIAICREWLKREIPARYVFVPMMLDELRACQNHDTEDSYFSMMRFYTTVPLLVMDDIGAEKTSEWVREKLTTIINQREEKGLYLVVTTNKSLENLPGDDEGRIGSRLRRYKFGKTVTIEDCGEYALWKESHG